jgi:hypothetical protein
LSFAVSFSQLLLAAVFTVAAIAKLADRTATGQAIEAFGLAPRLAAPAAILLPIAELASAAALIPAATARVGALAIVALLAVFSLAIARTLRAGSAPDCNCFGGIAQTEVGRGTLVRNGLLGAVAAFVVLSGQSVSALHWITVPAPGDRLAIAMMVACIAALAWFCWQLLQQNGRLLGQLDAAADSAPPPPGKPALPPLDSGTPAPGFDGHDLGGEPVSLDSLLAAGLPVALFFTDPGCGACELVLDAVATAQRERAEEMTLAVISGGGIDRIEQKAAEFGLNRVVPQTDDALFDAYRVRGFPALVEIAADGSVAGPPALGADPVRAVVLGAAAAPSHEHGEVVVR